MAESDVDVEAQKSSREDEKVPSSSFRSSESRREQISSLEHEQETSNPPWRRRVSQGADGAETADSFPPSAASKSLSPEDVEERGCFLFAEALRKDDSSEPWFMEMSRLRRTYFIYLNKQLAACRKKILETQRASDEDMKELGSLLHEQAIAIKDLQFIRSLDFLPAGEQKRRYEQSLQYFPHTGQSHFKDVYPFETENYRCMPTNPKTDQFSDEVREFLRSYLPVKWSWTQDEKHAKADYYNEQYKPSVLSAQAEGLARFIVAMVGALFILVPMYIMALHQNLTKSLVTTTVAVVFFAVLCSVTLRTSNDQTLAATAGYAAVLMVFVALTTT